MNTRKGRDGKVDVVEGMGKLQPPSAALLHGRQDIRVVTGLENTACGNRFVERRETVVVGRSGRSGHMVNVDHLLLVLLIWVAAERQ